MDQTPTSPAAASPQQDLPAEIMALVGAAHVRASETDKAPYPGKIFDLVDAPDIEGVS